MDIVNSPLFLIPFAINYFWVLGGWVLAWMVTAVLAIIIVNIRTNKPVRWANMKRNISHITPPVLSTRSGLIGIYLTMVLLILTIANLAGYYAYYDVIRLRDNALVPIIFQLIVIALIAGQAVLLRRQRLNNSRWGFIKAVFRHYLFFLLFYTVAPYVYSVIASSN